MSNETTPAIERATKVMQDEVNSWHTYDTRDLGDAYHESVGEAAVEKIPDALSAALDIEEMAREMVKHQRVAPYSERQCMCGVTVPSKETGAQHVAAAIRAALLGSTP